MNRVVCVMGLLGLSWMGCCPVAMGQDAPPLGDEPFNIDSVTGPVFAASRPMGMGGAYTALAEGLSGSAWNPASMGARAPWEDDFFEFGFSLNVSRAGIDGMNALRSGVLVAEAARVVHAEVGLRLQFGPVGVGGLGFFESYTLAEDGANLEVDLGGAIVGMGMSIRDGTWVIGVGGRYSTMDVRRFVPGEQAASFRFSGVGPTAGILYRPHGQPWRLGASFFGAASAFIERASGAVAMPDLRLPTRVIIPGEVRFGFAYQFGERPFNWRFINYRWLRRQVAKAPCADLPGEWGASLLGMGADLSCQDAIESIGDLPARAEMEAQLAQRVSQGEAEIEARQARRAERRRQLSRHFHLLSAEIGVVGQSPDAIPIDAFLAQRRVIAGTRYAFSLRIGYETEPVADRLKTRLGFYLEPGRVQDAPYRPHGTASVAVRIFHIGWWDTSYALTGSVDVAPGWLNFGVGLSAWR